MLHLATWWVLLLLPLPFIAVYLLPHAKPRAQSALRVPFFARLQALGGASRRGAESQGGWERVLASLIWILLIIALAGPEWLGKPVMIQQTGRNIMLAVDISGSMEIADMSLNNKTVNRLDMIKSVAGHFIDQREGDRLGLILFGTQAYLQTPLTFDRQTVHNMLNDATIGLAGQMTDIGDAIGLSVKRLMQYPAKSRVLVLLTDGAANIGSVDVIDAAKMAAAHGIQIYTIGIGSERAVVQTFWGPQYVNPSADLDEKTLNQIATLTKGQYFRAHDSQTLEQIYERINQLQPISSDKRIFRPMKVLYYWPLGFALLLSVVLFVKQMNFRFSSRKVASPLMDI
ncbi:MAG: VWA domain-containing protein [Legionellales bacterium]|nr:VWA domain-containing protein [Legionellales bacterium]